jgi:catalase
VRNGPDRFTGRKIGVLVAPGADAALLEALRTVVAGEDALLEVVAPAVGGVTVSDGTVVEADHMVRGGPSVLFDAVAVLGAPSQAAMADVAAARDFVADAFAHCKFIAHDAGAASLLEDAGVDFDGGVMSLDDEDDVERFVERCRSLRFWERELAPVTVRD